MAPGFGFASTRATPSHTGLSAGVDPPESGKIRAHKKVVSLPGVWSAAARTAIPGEEIFK
jgi:hypothetical protein